MLTGSEPLRPEACVVIHGPDHVVPDAIGLASLGGVGAVATCVGRFPKAYASVDPNEDAALIAVGNHRVVAAVVDGHLGYEAARATIQAVEEEAALLLAAPVPAVVSGIQTVLAMAEDQIAAALAATTSDLAASRTAVTLAVVHADAVYVATIGDTAGVLAGRGRRVKKFRSENRYLGPQHGPVKVQRRHWQPGDLLVLASDGFVDYGGRNALPGVVAATDTPEATARALVTAALDGGAGDNVTVAVVVLASIL